MFVSLSNKVTLHENCARTILIKIQFCTFKSNEANIEISFKMQVSYCPGCDKWYRYASIRCGALKGLIIMIAFGHWKTVIIIIGACFIYCLCSSLGSCQSRDRRAELSNRCSRPKAGRVRARRREANRKAPSVSVTGALLTGNFFRGAGGPEQARDKSSRPGRGQRLQKRKRLRGHVYSTA